MANPWRGDVALTIDGQRHVARLTLGALAELEDILDEPSLLSLVERFEDNSFSSRDVLRLLVAALRAGGMEVTETSLGNATIDGGPMGAAKAAAELLARAFVVPA
ncbi:gene transfer agent family protein [Sulfitobacter sp.]|uniref:gene transfer agent family protein n=1 Tax=Sulfitobacter sp. TaxID=1903071 RepID=UPI003569AFB3|tara:strand:+ start:1870 stop:2184 length:315 start_codon:yes stop_codon:yes gene_type:complete